MKITPMAATSNAAPQSNEMNTGRSASPERYARAVAAITGEAPQVPAQEMSQDKPSIQRIKMITQRSVNRYGNFTPEVKEQNLSNSLPTESLSNESSDILANHEQATEATEATKPLSPHFAALAKAKRAAQAKEAAIQAREQALAQQEADMKSAMDKLARLKANPMRVLEEEGITYDQLTESILNQNQINPDVAALKQELQAMREEFAKQQQQRDQVSREQALRMIRKDVDSLVSQGEDFETVREAGYAPKVVELIERWYNETGDVLDTSEAARMVENELLEEATRFARLKKVQSRLTPATPPQQPAQQQTGSKPILKTLTSRTGASAPLSARERAIAAFYGKI